MNQKYSIFILSFFVLLCSRSAVGQEFHIYQTLYGNDTINFASLRISAKEHSVGIIDSRAQVKAQIPVAGLILGIGKFDHDLLVFYTNEYKERGMIPIKEIHAATIDLKRRRILVDKVVYTNDTKYYLDPIIQNDPSGNFVALIVRTTLAKTSIVLFGFGNTNFDADRSQTSALSIIDLNSELVAKRKDVTSVVVGGFFATAAANSQHELYISSLSNGELITEKFDAARNSAGKLSTSLSFRDKSVYHAISSLDTLSGNAVDILVRYENQHKDELVSLFRFDFSAKKASSAPEVALNKDYEKTLKAEQPEKVKSSNLRQFERLVPVQIIETSDNIIAVKEIQFTYALDRRDAATRYTRESAVISVYGKDLHLVKELVVDKTAETFIEGGNAIYAHVNDGKLYAVTCEIAGIAAYKDCLYTINMQNWSMDKKVLERSEAGRGSFFSPAPTFWFSKNFVIPLEFSKAFFSVKFSTSLQSHPYQ